MNRSLALLLWLLAPLGAFAADDATPPCDDKNHFILDAPCGPDVTTWTWTATSSMAIARFGHTATRLRDGRVLISGGRTPTGPTRSTEIYDPVTQSWTSAADMNAPRAFHLATLLADGRVFVVSGDAKQSSADLLRVAGTSEIVDPATGQWTLTGTLGTPRTGATLTVLDDSSALLVGGVDVDDDVISRAEIYDRGSGMWHYTAPMVVARFWHTATRLADGRVLITAGWGDDLLDSMTGDTEVYDPANDAWITVTPLSVARGSAAAASLADGSVLVMGGYTAEPTTYATSDRLFPDGRGTRDADLVHSRAAHSASTLPNGSILVTGGYGYNPAAGVLSYPGVLSSTEIYDATTGRWLEVGMLNEGRSLHTATVLGDGTVLVVGGYTDGYLTLSSAEIFGPPIVR